MSEELRDKELLIERKARFFYNSGEKVHMILKRKSLSGKRLWENGWIKHEPSQDHFILTYTDEGALKHKTADAPYFNLEVEDIVACEVMA